MSLLLFILRNGSAWRRWDSDKLEFYWEADGLARHPRFLHEQSDVLEFLQTIGDWAVGDSLLIECAFKSAGGD